jgi:hypothetical protein
VIHPDDPVFVIANVSSPAAFPLTAQLVPNNGALLETLFEESLDLTMDLAVLPLDASHVLACDGA